MAKRNVLVLHRSEAVFDQLRALPPDETLLPATSLAAARQILIQKRCLVGLVVFDGGDTWPRGELENLLAAAVGTEWIALVTGEAMGVSDFPAFLLRVFHDYHTLPVDIARLAVIVGHAGGRAALRLRLRLGKGLAPTGRYGICGASPAMARLFQQLDKVVDADLPVLITGESGTGKELVSQAIHRHSRRAGGPFVVVNCGAIPANLIQSELFGHERGAFTGALQRKIGSIEAANGGVLFLDEIGDLPLELQANLLRVLQERTVTRLGATQAVHVDFRLVAATHVDLPAAIRAGRFREDLYYRLNVIHLHLPPLRERGADVHLLAETILRECAARQASRVTGFSAEAMRAMSAYAWPGNVRELINRVQRAVIMCEQRLIGAADLGLAAPPGETQPLSLEDARASFDRDIIEATLRANGNNVTQTARQLGISRVTLYRILNRSLAG